MEKLVIFIIMMIVVLYVFTPVGIDLPGKVRAFNIETLRKIDKAGK